MKLHILCPHAFDFHWFDFPCRMVVMVQWDSKKDGSDGMESSSCYSWFYLTSSGQGPWALETSKCCCRYATDAAIHHNSLIRKVGFLSYFSDDLCLTFALFSHLYSWEVVGKSLFLEILIIWVGVCVGWHDRWIIWLEKDSLLPNLQQINYKRWFN